MNDQALNDAIPDGLANNVLRVLLRIEVELDTNVAEGDTRVGKGETSYASLDDILAKAHDESVCLVGFELGSVFRQCGLKLG